MGLDLKIKLDFFCQFSNPWVLGVSRIGCYVRKCENAKITAPYLLTTVFVQGTELFLSGTEVPELIA